MSPVTVLILLITTSSHVSSYTESPGAELYNPARKPGTCPADVDFPTCGNNTTLRSECQEDGHCEGARKCCYSGCRRRCLLPLQDKLNPCPYFNHSQCIHIKPSPSDCRSDDQCPGTDRCCCYFCRHQCTPTVKVKSGQCPAPLKKCLGIVSTPKCKSDGDCPGNKKCCDQCGVKCVTPEKDHPGVCPTSLENLSCIFLNKTLCNRDSDCPKDQKCCLSGDVLRCQVVNNEKSGSCPIPVTRCKTPLPKPLCTSDRDCPGDKKCCSPECQRKCTDPLQMSERKQCPRDNALIQCPVPYPEPECSSDPECGPNQKCCDIGCRVSCVEM